MKKSLSDIDEIYRTSVSHGDVTACMDYCNRIIDKAQFCLKNLGRFLSVKQKEELMEKIELARKEISIIKKNK